MMMRRSAVLFRTQIAVFLGAALCSFPGGLTAAPRVPSARSSAEKAPARRPAEPTESPAPDAAPKSSGREFADALPTSNSASTDLRLSKEQERKAYALARFAQALLLEDAAENDK